MGESSNNIEIQEDNLIEQEFQALLTDYLHSNHRKKVDIIERASDLPKMLIKEFDDVQANHIYCIRLP